MAQRIAVVTGAGSGVGRASALALLNNGYGVALAGRRADALAETAGMAKGGEAICVPTDVTSPEQVAALFAAVKTKWNRLDVLFNNAGGNVPATNFGDFTYDMFKHVVDVNLIGMFLCANAAYRAMRDQDPQGGRIINNGSLSAQRPRLNTAPYTAAKHAINGLTKATALDGRAFNIACGQIDIGNAATDMTSHMSDGVLQATGKMVGEPTINPEHVAQAVLYMANLPLDVNVPFMTVMATQMPFMGRG